MTAVARLHERLAVEGLPVVSVEQAEAGGPCVARLLPVATPEQLARAAALCAAPPEPTADERARDVLARSFQPETAAALLLLAEARGLVALSQGQATWAKKVLGDEAGALLARLAEVVP
jgi:hypothetical protein